MIVPRYWAEGRVKRREGRRQLTVRRFGWSDTSPDDAQAMADARAQEAFDRAWAGERLPQREWKVPYNGADGVPIREEILSTHGTAVVTRNSYGAACLNTPDVFFADLDFGDFDPMRKLANAGCVVVFSMVILAGVIGTMKSGSPTRGLGMALLLALAWGLFAWIGAKVIRKYQGSPEANAREHVKAFVEARPEWGLRIYQTPAGLRLIATHRTFDPTSSETASALADLRSDSVYVRMCQKQACFRARLTAKPWRIGVDAHMRPRPGVWPIAPERMADRQAWVTQYEAAAGSFAACRFIEALGNRTVHPRVREVQRIHDQLSRAESTLPLA